MRIIRDGEPPKVLKEGEHPKKEIKATCSNCLTKFAFQPHEPGVTVTNEMECLVDCPSCGTALQVQG